MIVGSIHDWRQRLLEKLEAAARVYPPATDVDLSSLADHVFTVFEGGFILTRALDEPAHLPAQLAHVRHYLQLLFGLSPRQPGRRRRAARARVPGHAGAIAPHQPEASDPRSAVTTVATVGDPPAGYQVRVNAPRGRRIWHFEAEPLREALNNAGAWQTALRVRVAHRGALRRDRDRTAFNYRPTPEDVVPLNRALDALRAQGHDAITSRSN